MAKDIRDLAVIPPETLERFFPLQDEGLGPLRAAGIELAGLSRFSPGYEIIRHRPNMTVALYVFEGAFQADLGRGLTDLEGPGLLRYAAGAPSRYRSGPGPWRALWFHLGTGTEWEGGEAEGASWRAGIAEPRIESLAEGLLAEAEGRSVYAAEAAEAYSRLLLIHLRRDLTAETTTPALRAFEKTLDAVRDRLSRTWSLAELSAYSGLSARHLNRLFHARTGMSPLRFVSSVKMRRARELIEHTALGLADIARAVGYKNAFAFSTAFRRELGKSPSFFRRSPGEE